MAASVTRQTTQPTSTSLSPACGLPFVEFCDGKEELTKEEAVRGKENQKQKEEGKDQRRYRRNEDGARWGQEMTSTFI